MNRSTSANSTISSNLRAISPPAHAEDRAVQEDVLAPRQLGVEARADLEQRADAAPDRAPRPSVGSVMRDRIFSSVVLPAPFRPMMPSTSPAATSKRDVVERPDPSRARGCRAARDGSAGAPLRGDRVAQRPVEHVALAEPVALAEVADLTRSRGSDDVGERTLHAAEVEQPRRRARRAARRARARCAEPPAGTPPSSDQRKPSTTPAIGLSQ